ncbi:MAG: hypothetical protein ACKO0V_18610, partial [bacterium]
GRSPEKTGNQLPMIEKKTRNWLYLASAVFLAWVGFLLFMAMTSSLKPPEKKATLACNIFSDLC